MTEDNLMSDAVMVPRVPTGAMISAGERAAWDEDNSMPAISAMRKAWEAMLAASTPVGGWEDISTAPKDGTMFLARCGDWTPFECEWDGERFVHMDPEDGPIAYKPDQWHPLNRCPNCNGFGFLDAPPPPSVSIGSRPQEAVPPELSDADGVVLCEGAADSSSDLERAWEILAAIPAINDLGSQYQEDIQAAILTALRARPQPADGCSINEGAG